MLPGAAAAAPAAPANPCAAGPVTTPLVASATRLGFIGLHFVAALGAPVTFYECVGDRAVELGTRTRPATVTSLWRATIWSCTRLARDFAATATLPGGSTARGTGSIRTRSCAHRFAFTVPRRVAPGGLARVRIADRWHVGDARTKLCLAPPGRRLTCQPVIFTTGAAHVRAFRVAKRGRWRVELRVPGHSTRASIAVGVRAAARKPALPLLLATGDSTMDGLDSFLSDQLGDEQNVVSQVDPGLAISKSDAFQPMAVKLLKRLRPATTVVSIGANEGFPMRGADGAMHECCDAQWVEEYARRVRRTMVTFARRVFWCTIVAPKEARRVSIFAAANAGILQAAEGLANVHVVRMDLLFTPSGYQETIRYRGRDVRVREPDGVHLNVAGTEIAALEVVKALRATP
jgi:hypothetical protein